MALGKPVICFVRKECYLLSPDECPIVRADPNMLADAIKDFVKDPEKRKRLGEMGRKYVEKHYPLEAFAHRLKEAYERHGIL